MKLFRIDLATINKTTITNNNKDIDDIRTFINLNPANFLVKRYNK